MSAESYMRKVIALAKSGIMKAKGPFASLIVRDDKIIAEGYNEVTTSNDPTAHSEIQAIRQACKKIKNFKLNNCDLYCNSLPCTMCLSAIYWAGINKVYYGTSYEEAAAIDFDDKTIYNKILNSLGDEKLIQLLNAEALDVFKAWQEYPKKMKY